MDERDAGASDDAMAAFIAAHQAEMDRLPQDADGAIADTYANLQGVPLLELAQRRIPEGAADAEKLMATLCQAAVLSRIATSDLLASATGHLTSRQADKIDLAARDTRWLASIIEVEWSMLRRLSTLVASSGGSPDLGRLAESEIFEASTAARGAFAAALDGAVSANADRFRLAIWTGTRAQGTAQLKQDVKVAGLLLEHCDAVWRDTPLPFDVGWTTAPRALLAAYGSIKTRTPTALPQFRLLHQAPELLAFRLCDEVEAALAEPAEALIDRLIRLVDIAELLLELQRPLVWNMLPSAYYPIRKHLGVTSGSHSARLSKKALSGDYVRLAEHVMRAADAAASPAAGRTARTLLVRYRDALTAWRDLHMAFPRNVLGADHTRSLIGSDDAIETVRLMRGAFLSRDPLSLAHGAQGGAPPLKVAPAADIARSLVQLTGEVTREKFPNVQNREGRYRPKR